MSGSGGGGGGGGGDLVILALILLGLLMLLLIFGAVIYVVVSLLYSSLRLYQNSKKGLKVPGLKASSNESGNLKDIGKAGSLHEFLTNLHKEFGPISSFWWGSEQTVSIASPELFKQHQHIFDRPLKPFKQFKPFFGHRSIAFCNGEEGKSRRETFDKVFNFENLGIYYGRLQKVADEVVQKWERAGPDDHLCLGDTTFLYAAKSALVSLMGETFVDDKECMAFARNYQTAWNEMERRQLDPQLPSEGSERMKTFNKAMDTLRAITAKAVKEREAHGEQSRDFLLIDAVINYHANEDARFEDAFTYTVAGFHTTANLLRWCVYYLAKHQDIQDKVYEEIVAILGTEENLSHQTLSKLKYQRQVLDETLRCSVLAPWAARACDQDMELGGFNIPANTPVIEALGVVLMDEKTWPEPEVFNPDRFSPEGSHGRPTIAFSPYGFAGRRQCPGYRFAYVEASILLVTALQKVKFTLVPGQDIRRQYGFVTHPNTDVWVKVEHRK